MVSQSGTSRSWGAWLLTLTMSLSAVLTLGSAQSAAASPTWSSLELVGTFTIQSASINDLSCAGANFCVAGGQYTDASNNRQALVSTFNGVNWSSLEVAGGLNTTSATINAVSCVSATFCVAGGQYTDASNNRQALVGTFGGSSWSSLEVAGGLNTTSATINAVSCVSATFCVAGGHYTDAGGNQQAFVSTFDGSSWSSLEVPPIALSNSAQVNSISCVSPTFCVAGGKYADSNFISQAFVSTFDGSSWSSLEVAGGLNTTSATINAVSCVSTTFCAVDGYFDDRGFNSHSFVGTFSGVSWSAREVLPVTGGTGASASSVACVSATFCVAGGQYLDTNGIQQAFVSTFDGSSWSSNEVAGSLNVRRGKISSVACASATLCVAGGSYTTSGESTLAFASSYLASPSTAPPSTPDQSPLFITNSTSATTGNPVTLTTSGGSGIIAPLFSVTGAGCSLVGNQLSASGEDNCTVIALNPANDGYSAVVSAPVTIHFALPPIPPIISVTVTFNANGGGGTMAPETSPHATPRTLTANSFTFYGERFTGWNTAANGAGTHYANGATYPFAAPTTLYAQWHKLSVTVTFNANGGGGTMAPETSPHATPRALTANSFVRHAFTFIAWSTSPTGSSADFANHSTYDFAKSITLFAQWGRVVPPSSHSRVLVGTILFANNVSQVSEYYQHQLEKMAKLILTAHLRHVIIVSSASDLSSAAYNFLLSEKRAVSTALILRTDLSALHDIVTVQVVEKWIGISRRYSTLALNRRSDIIAVKG